MCFIEYFKMFYVTICMDWMFPSIRGLIKKSMKTIKIKKKEKNIYLYILNTIIYFQLPSKLSISESIQYLQRFCHFLKHLWKSFLDIFYKCFVAFKRHFIFRNKHKLHGARSNEWESWGTTRMSCFVKNYCTTWAECAEALYRDKIFNFLTFWTRVFSSYNVSQIEKLIDVILVCYRLFFLSIYMTDNSFIIKKNVNISFTWTRTL